MKYLLSILFIVLISCSSSTSDEPNVSHDSDEWQIWAYSKAAPDFIGEFATIVGGNGKVIREGSNGWTCTATLEMPEGGFELLNMEIPFVPMKKASNGLKLI